MPNPSDKPPTRPPAAQALDLAARPVTDALESDGDLALDALAALLLELRENPLPTDQPTPWEPAEAWSAHLLMGGPPPSKPGATKTGGRRDFAELRAFALQARQAEQAQVKASLAGLRQGLSACVEILKTSMVADTSADSQVSGSLEKLERAASQGAPADLRREVQQAVLTIGKSLQERRQRQQTQLQTMAKQLSAAVGELRAAQREVLVDSLTKLANRRAFDLQGPRVLRMRDEFNQTATMLFVDCDHFKNVNDRYGHPVGDAVLRKVAEILTRCFPRRGDFIGRYGGEEFVVLLSDVPRAAGQKLGERCLAAVREQKIDAGGHIVQVTVSIGVAQLRIGESFEAWTERADKALYQAKAQGRDRVVVAN